MFVLCFCKFTSTRFRYTNIDHLSDNLTQALLFLSHFMGDIHQVCINISKIKYNPNNMLECFHLSKCATCLICSLYIVALFRTKEAMKLLFVGTKENKIFIMYVKYIASSIIERTYDIDFSIHF